jgi:hypothetical protein
MKHIKPFDALFEEVVLTPQKKSELLNLIKKDVSKSIRKILSTKYNENSKFYVLENLVKKIKEFAGIDAKSIFDDVIRKTETSDIPLWTLEAVSNGKAPYKSLEFMTNLINSQIKLVTSKIPWTKKKLIGVAMRTKGNSKSAFIAALKQTRLKEYWKAENKDIPFNFYSYQADIDPIIFPSSPFISKEDYFISSEKKDVSRANYNKFIESDSTTEFKKKMEESFDSIIGTLWDSI